MTININNSVIAQDRAKQKSLFNTSLFTKEEKQIAYDNLIKLFALALLSYRPENLECEDLAG